MTQSLQKQLYNKYKLLFFSGMLVIPPKENENTFSIHCDDGWYNLIDDILQKFYLYKQSQRIGNFYIWQITTVNGILYVYPSVRNKEIESILQETKKSLHICEKCGVKSNDVTQYHSKLNETHTSLLRTLCPKCNQIEQNVLDLSNI